MEDGLLAEGKYQHTGLPPLANILVNKFGGQYVGIIGGVLVAGGHLCLGLLSTSSEWGLLVSIFLSGSGFGLLNIVTILPLKEHFRNSYHLAFSVSLLASSLGVAVLPLLLDKLLRTFTRVEAMVIFGTLSWSLVSIGIFIPTGVVSEYDKLSHTSICKDEVIQSEQTPLKDNHTASANQKDRDISSNVENEPESDKTKFTTEENGLLLGIQSLLRHHLDILYLVCIYGIYIANYCSWSIFLVPYGEFLGFSPKRAVWLSTIGGTAALVGRLFSAVLYYYENVNVKLGLGVSALVVAVSYSLSLIFDNFALLVTVAFISGFALSVQGNFCVTHVPMWVCDDHFKSAVVLLYAVGGLMAEFGGITSGGIIDLTGSHSSAFAMAAVLCLLQFIFSVLWSTTSCKTEASSTNP